VFFDDTFVSDLLAFRTLPCSPGQMQAPSLARRDRTLLKVRLCKVGCIWGRKHTSSAAVEQFQHSSSAHEQSPGCGDDSCLSLSV
jgi:hypothetical protein